jgi:inhibitor of KinA
MVCLEPLGEHAWLARFETEEQAWRWSEAVRVGGEADVADVVLAYRSVAVIARPESPDLDGLAGRLTRVRPLSRRRAEPPAHLVPVLYDGEDLEDVAATLDLESADVVALHSNAVYQVHALGFQPGFPYLGYLPAPLDRIQRRASPRVRVPAGSVAIAAGQTGIYPTELPGGWALLGRTPVVIVDVAVGFFPIQPGDSVRFVPITPDEFSRRLGERLACPPST